MIENQLRWLYTQRRPLEDLMKIIDCMIFTRVKRGEGDQEGYWESC